MPTALKPGTTDYTMRGDRELIYTRVLDAPRPLVYSTFTEAEHLVNWMGLTPGSMKVPLHDFTVGGKYRWDFHGPDGEIQVTITGEFTEIIPNEYIQNTEMMEFGGQQTPEYPTSLTFSDEGDQTKVVGTVTFPDADAAKAAVASGMKDGMDAGFDHLDALLAKLKN